MRVYLIKVTSQENVNRVIARQNFIHDDIYNFETEIQVHDLVFLYFGGDSAQVSWPIGLRGIGKIVRGPYDQGYNANNPRYFKVEIEPVYVLNNSIPPEETKVHPEFSRLIYDVPYVGAKHFPNQAIQRTENVSAILAVLEIFCEQAPQVDRDLIWRFGDPLTIEEKMEGLFAMWMCKATYANGERYQKSTIERYTRALREYISDPLFAGLGVKNVFTVAVKSEMTVLNSRIRAVTGFGEFNDSHNNGDLSAALNQYIKFLGDTILGSAQQSGQKAFIIDGTLITSFNEDAGLQLSGELFQRFVGALMAKRFVLLTGLSGSGKTKLAEAFATWICKDARHYRIVPVGADWTSREPLLGYPNALKSGEYIKPDNGVLDLLIEAAKEENESIPFFLILDEMNLSHVERYFADFLSAMESGGDIFIRAEGDEWNGFQVPARIKVPKNLFIIGTVNVDETTYMFSPKVLDRANVIEFRITEDEMALFLQKPVRPDLEKIAGKGACMAEDFVKLSTRAYDDGGVGDEVRNSLKLFFTELKEVGAEFGFRSAFEIFRFAGVLRHLSPVVFADDVIDAAVMQKLLPKLHGSRNKLEDVLKKLAGLCLKNQTDLVVMMKEPRLSDYRSDNRVRFPLSFEKIRRMHFRLIKDGFVSFAEA
ncbi:MAG: hypothetical protein HQL22_10535 [Candidatus Omnitrophica bacterium]|nr:hypothetical protein [Candidatus Omnitrophota bacterium]